MQIPVPYPLESLNWGWSGVSVLTARRILTYSTGTPSMLCCAWPSHNPHAHTRVQSSPSHFSAFLNLTRLPRPTNTLITSSFPLPRNLPLTLHPVLTPLPPVPQIPLLRGGHKTLRLRPPIIFSRVLPKSLILLKGVKHGLLLRSLTAPITQQHSQTTRTYLNVPDLVHGTRQVVHLVQKGPELSQGHL